MDPDECTENGVLWVFAGFLFHLLFAYAAFIRINCDIAHSSAKPKHMNKPKRIKYTKPIRELVLATSIGELFL